MLFSLLIKKPACRELGNCESSFLIDLHCGSGSGEALVSLRTRAERMPVVACAWSPFLLVLQHPFVQGHHLSERLTQKLLDNYRNPDPRLLMHDDEEDEEDEEEILTEPVSEPFLSFAPSHHLAALKRSVLATRSAWS